MIALAKGLRSAGHDVTVIGGSNFGDWVSGHGLRFVPSVDIEALMSSEKGVAWSQSSDSPMKQIRMGDQPYWGRRVHELGVGVRPVPRHKLTVESLSAGLDRLVRDPRIRDAAATLGRKIRAEQGVQAAVAAIERRAH